MVMKKKRTALAALSVLLVLCLAACGGNPGSSVEKTSSPPANVSGAPLESQEAVPTPMPNSGTMIGSGDLGDYHVEIKNAFLAKDYEGKPVIVITYSWTNNSDDTTSAMAAVSGKAFQDGVQMDIAMLFNVDGYESGSSMKEVRPGTTIDVQSAYVMTSETSTVEFEISEFLSFSDNMVTMNFDPASLS